METKDHEQFMRVALREAEKALEAGEVPVGCVITYEGRIIARAHNQRETLKDPTAHAEMIAITQASAHLETWRLHGCNLYVTLEPCAMCAGAMVLARLDKLFFGAHDPKTGACGSLFAVQDDPRLNHRIETQSGLLADECGGMLTEFFRKKRLKAKSKA